MRRRTIGWVSLLAILLVGGAVAVDALIETEEERVLALADDLAGPVTAASLRARAARWVDLDRAPLELSALGTSSLYEAGDETELFERADRGLRQAYGGDVRVLSSRADVDDDRARLTTQLIVPRVGMCRGTWDLERHDDDWLVVRIAITR